jgi:hypothetical protein
LRGNPKNQFASFRRFNPRKLATSKTLNPPKSTLAQGPQAFFTDDYKGFQVLIDGYFRGLLFVRSAALGERVAVLF